MSTRNILLIILAFILLGGAAYLLTKGQSGQVACTAEALQCPDGSSVGRTGPNCEFAKCPEVDAPQTYTNTKYGLEFMVPSQYEVTEQEVGNGERYHYSIVLTRKADLPPPQNGEGPPTISIDIFQNNLDKMTLLTWLTGTNASNFKLSDGTYSSTSIDGTPAVSYHWSGLYEADALAFIHKENIIMISGMYLDPGDKIRGDFQSVVKSVRLR